MKCIPSLILKNVPEILRHNKNVNSTAPNESFVSGLYKLLYVNQRYVRDSVAFITSLQRIAKYRSQVGPHFSKPALSVLYQHKLRFTATKSNTVYSRSNAELTSVGLVGSYSQRHHPHAITFLGDGRLSCN